MGNGGVCVFLPYPQADTYAAHRYWTDVGLAGHGVLLWFICGVQYLRGAQGVTLAPG